jgi:DNA-binding PadR family transcriptional regulator
MQTENESLLVEMNRGFLQLLALVALEHRMYGYGMVRHLEEVGFKMDENTLYPLLRRLEKNGWIQSEWEINQDRPRKFYQITPAGKQIRSQTLAIWQEQKAFLKKLMEVSHVSSLE